MSHYVRTPRMVTPRLAPQPPPVLYATVNAAPYQPAGTHYPGQVFHVAPSEPGYSRGRHRSSSRSRNHKRSHSSGGRRHHHHHHRSSTPSHSMPSHYSPGNQYATIPSPRHRRHSVSGQHHRSSSRGPHRSAQYGYHDHHNFSHRGESISIRDRIKRFFGIGTYRVRFGDADHRSGYEVDRFGRPVRYAP